MGRNMRVVNGVIKKILLFSPLIFFAFSTLIWAQTEFIGRSEIQHLNWGGTEKEWGRIHTIRDLRIYRGPNGRLDLLLEEVALLEPLHDLLGNPLNTDFRERLTVTEI